MDPWVMVMGTPRFETPISHVKWVVCKKTCNTIKSMGISGPGTVKCKAIEIGGASHYIDLYRRYLQ